MKKGKLLFAAAAAAMIIMLPASRAYLIGVLVGYRLYKGHVPARYRIVPKGSKHYNRLIHGEG